MNEITTRILKWLVMIFAVVLASTIFYHLLFPGYETENATYYSVSNGSAFQGVYVREETPVLYSGNGAVRYCVPDGAKLGVGSVLAEIYPGEDQIDLRRRIAEKENELAMLMKIENPGTSENAQPIHLASQIEEQYKTLVHLRECGSYDALEDCKQTLTVLMSTYNKITDQNIDFHARIVALEDEIQKLNAQKTDPIEVITTDKSAYFVSYADGYEDSLRVETINQLTPEQLSNVRDDSSGADKNAIGKLIDGYSWYITGIFDNTKLRLSEGDSVSVRLASVSRELRVTVESLMSAGDITKTQGVFRCEQLTGDFVQHRTERVEILRDTVEGIRIPRSAIRFRKMPVEATASTSAPEETTTTVQQTSLTGMSLPGESTTANLSERASSASTTMNTTEEDTGTTEENTTVSTGEPEMETCMGVYVLVGETAEFRKIDVIYEDDSFYLSALDAGEGYVALYDDIIVKGVNADGG